MRRRLAFAIAGVAVVAVVLAGVGTTLLSWRQARLDATTQLGNEAVSMVPFITEPGRLANAEGEPGLAALTRRVRGVRRALRLLDAGVLVTNRSGAVVSGTAPDGVDGAALRASAIDGETRHGIGGRVAWAVAASEPGPGGRRIVVALTRQVSIASGALPWVAGSALVAVALALLAAGILARRLSEPLGRVEAATRRIAGGDLEARVGAVGSEAGEELARLARSVDAMAAALEHSSSAQRDFLMSISHDLRTPLTSMRGYAEAIVDGAAPDAAAAAQVICTQSRRLERLVADLLDLARLEAHQFTVSHEPVDLVVLARGALHAFGPAATAASISLEFSSDVASAVVTGDPDRIGQVCANLIENALKFAERTVAVRVSRDSDRAMVTVSDDGPGIRVEDLPHVFDRGFAARPTPSGGAVRSLGSGLGLTISQGLVRAMGGTVAASGDRGFAGTTMTVCLPITDGEPGLLRR